MSSLSHCIVDGHRCFIVPWRDETSTLRSPEGHSKTGHTTRTLEAINAEENFNVPAAGVATWLEEKGKERETPQNNHKQTEICFHFPPPFVYSFSDRVLPTPCRYFVSFRALEFHSLSSGMPRQDHASQ